MKKFYTVLFAFFFICASAIGQTEFITKWDTRLTSASGNPSASNATLQFGATGTNYTVSYTEVGGSNLSGTFPTQTSSYPTLVFPEPGVYVVKMSGITGYRSNRAAAPDPVRYVKGLLEIQQWGNTHWTGFTNAFYGCSNMDITATDAPDLSGVSTFFGLFQGCASLTNANGSINSWDVSHVSNMYAVFFQATAFNQPLNNWNTSNVTEIGFMFAYATSFNQNISSWDVSKVTGMQETFVGATAFNQPLNNWNTSSVTNMIQMFQSATAFNQPLNNWNTASVTSMSQMFQDAHAFDQDLSSWQVGNVTNMNNMFFKASVFNQNLGTWNLKSIIQGATSGLTEMLSYSGLSCTNYDATLDGWAANSNTPNGLTLGATGMVYSSTSGVASRNTLISTNGWTINGDTYDATCDAIGLPITLTDFNASAQNSQIKLMWATPTENNNKGFAVQRSDNGNTKWQTLDFVDSKATNGTSTATLVYHYTDNSPNSGINYYRLIQTDLNGKETISGMASANFTGKAAALKIYPNPAHGTVTIGGLTAGTQVAIYNTTGQLMQRFVAKSDTQKVNIGSLATGIYYVKMGTTNEQKLTGTFIVK